MLKDFLESIKKEERIAEKTAKPYEQNPMNYTVHQRIIVVGFSMVIVSLYSKILNLFHWTFISEFDMSSYPPELAYTYMISSLLALAYGYLKKDKILEFLGLVGLGYTLIFLWGLYLTYPLNELLGV